MKLRGSWELLFLLFLIFFSFILSYRGISHLQKARKEAPSGSFKRFKGVVTTLPAHRGGKSRYFLRTEQGFLIDVTQKGPPPEIGDLLVLDGWVKRLSHYRNPGSFNRQRYYDLRGIAFPFFARHFTLMKEKRLPYLTQKIGEMRSLGVNLFKTDLGDVKGCVMASLVLGFREGLDWHKRALFTDTGLGHLLAVSGFHMGVVFILVFTLLRLVLKCLVFAKELPLLFTPSRLSMILTALVLLLYFFLSGARISAFRALVMILCWMVALFIERERSLARALFLAFLVLLLWDPRHLLDVGFQLTFAAMLGVIVALDLAGSRSSSKGLRKRSLSMRWRQKGYVYVAMALIIPLFISPLMAYHFHCVYPYSFFANLFLLPLASLLVMMGIMHLLLLPLPFLKPPILFLESFLLTSLLDGLSSIKGLPCSLIYLTRRETIFLTLFVATLFIMLGMRLSPRFLPLLLLPLLAFIPSNKGHLVFMDMGYQGASLLCESHQANYLVDAGSKGGFKAFSSLRDCLLWRDVRTIDALVLSKLSPSRASLVPQVLMFFKVDSLYLPLKGEKRGLEEEILRVARERKVKVVRVEEPTKVGPLLLHPRGTRSLAVNIKGMVLKEARNGWHFNGKFLRPWRGGAIILPLQKSSPL